MGKSIIIVDGSNAYASCRTLGFQPDYAKLKALLGSKENTVLRALYFTAVNEDQEVDTLRPMLDFLEYNGWSIVSKPTKTFVDTVTGERKIKGNMDMEIAIEALKMAPYVDEVFLLSGDGNFKALVIALQSLGVKVTIVSTIETNPPMCADILRRQADDFIDLNKLRSVISRPGSVTRKFRL